MDNLENTLNEQASLFVGVDQTGAVFPNGKAKPLPVALAFDSNHRHPSRPTLRLTDSNGNPLTLSSFSRTCLGDTLEVGLGSHGRSLASSSSTLLLVDCVFGLPSATWPRHASAGSQTLWSLFQRAAKNEGERNGYGLKNAARFFDSILREGLGDSPASLPVRECELLAKANSVFRTHPFQKNIQCGTYRIWRDLGQAEEPWVQIRFFEKKSRIRLDQPWMFEAYPSLFWRRFLKLPTRDLTRLKAALQSALPSLHIERRDLALLESSADHADAAVLALGGLLLKRSQALFNAPIRGTGDRLAKEGWIVGLIPPAPAKGTER